MSKIPVGATIAHAYRFAFRDFFRILGVMWLPMAVMWLPSIVMRPRMMALQAQMAAHDYSSLRQMWQLLLPFYLLCFFFLFMQFIGIAQEALGTRKGPSWVYFSVGKPVWRLIGSLLLMMLAAIIGWLAVFLGGLLIGFLIGLVMKAANNHIFNLAGGAVIAVAMAALWCGYVYSLVRLSFLLTPVIAAREEGFALSRAWTLGKGNFWRMFAIILAFLVPLLVVEAAVLFGWLFRGISFPAPNAPEQSALFQAAIQGRINEMSAGMYHYWYFTFPIFAIVMVLFYGASVGAQCFAWRALTGSAPVAGDGLPD